MPTGFKLPMSPSPSGGIALVKGDVNNDKIIKVGLSATDNSNSFQQNIGIGQDMVFDLQDPALRGLLVVKIKKLFARFEIQKRFKLLTDTLQWSAISDSGELQLEFRYMDLESDEEKQFSKNFKAGE